MMRRYPYLVAAGLALLFAAGVVYLFRLRQASGDSYAPYSSLRSDPLGTMVLFEALEKVPGISVKRDYSVSNRMPDGKATTYLHLGAPARSWRYLEPDILKQIEQFAAGGGRLVITLRADTISERQTGWSSEEPSGKKEQDKEKSGQDKQQSKKKQKSKKKKDASLPGSQEREDRWKFAFAYKALATDEMGEPLPAIATLAAEQDLPGNLDWHSPAVLTNLASGWSPVYVREGAPVVAEQKFGSGSVVLATDTFFLSNEGLNDTLDTRLLLWAIGDSRQVVFDEAHLGTTDSPGISGLIRKYRLGWFVAGLVVLAGLYVWKNSASLLPPVPVAKAADRIEGKSSSAGFINLLRRNLRPSELPRVCLDQWKRAFQQGQGAHEKAAAAEHIFFAQTQGSATAQDPVELYNQLKSVIKPARKNKAL